MNACAMQKDTSSKSLDKANDSLTQDARSNTEETVTSTSTTDADQAPPTDESNDSKQQVTQKSAKIGPYLLEMFFDESYGTNACGLELLRNGQIEYRCGYRTDQKTDSPFCQFNVIDPNRLDPDIDNEGNCEVVLEDKTSLTYDINKDGVPILILSASTGGNGLGNSETIIIQAGEKGPKEIYCGDPCKFVKRSDGSYKIISTVLYSGGGSPPDGVFIKVPLVWNGKSYATSVKLLSKPAPTIAELKAQAANIHKQLLGANDTNVSDARTVRGFVVSEIMGLIFSGNAQSARKLIYMIYPGPAKIHVEGIIADSLETGDFTSSELWQSIVKGLKERIASNDKGDEDIEKYLPFVVKLNPELFR